MLLVGQKVVKPLWQTTCKFFKELHKETARTNTLGVGSVFPLLGLLLWKHVGHLGQEVTD